MVPCLVWCTRMSMVLRCGVSSFIILITCITFPSYSCCKIYTSFFSEQKQSSTKLTDHRRQTQLPSSSQQSLVPSCSVDSKWVKSCHQETGTEKARHKHNRAFFMLKAEELVSYTCLGYAFWPLELYKISDLHHLSKPLESHVSSTLQIRTVKKWKRKERI